MITIKQRLIREHNRAYKLWMRLLWRCYGMESPLVFMAHGFKNSIGECKNAFELSRDSFERFISFLMNEGWRALSQDELFQMVQKRKWQKKCFHLTFDDTYDTVFTDAYPILKRYGIPFTMFVTKDLVDKDGYITMEHLRLLAKDPLCSIGGHGLQHLVFRNLSGEEMREQCAGVKWWIEQEMGNKVKAFAFPYGRIIEVSNQNRWQMPSMGYEFAFSALEGTVITSWFMGEFFLPRVNVSEQFVEKFMLGKFPQYRDCEGR